MASKNNVKYGVTFFNPDLSYFSQDLCKYHKNIDMKKYLPMILIFLAVAIPANAQWKKVKGIPAPYDNAYYLDVYFLESNPNYGWACGRNGVTIRTTDGGENWSVTIIPNAYQLESIHFANEKVGYTSGLISSATSSGGVFKTTDGGKSWTNVSPGGQVDVWGTYFMDENVGLSIGGGCGNNQQFYRTTNGGKNWIGFYQYVFESGLSDLTINETTGVGFATSSGVIWISYDFGMTWNVFCETGGRDWQEEITLYGKTFLLPYSTGCTGSNGSGGARISTNMGASWSDKSFGTPMFGAYLHDDKTGWVVGWRRSCYFTSDAGKTWENKNCGITPGADLDDIWFINDTLGFVVGLGVYKYIGFNPPNPEIKTSSTFPACNGDTVILYTNGYYEQFKWSTGETTPSIRVTKPGTYTLWAANNECDSATSKPFIVSFHPKTELNLMISDTTNLCEGDSVTAQLINPKITEIKWSTGETSDIITIKTSGTYFVTALDSNGCEVKDSIKISFSPLPEALIDIIGKTDFCVGDSVWLVSRYDYEKYEWYKDNEQIPFSLDKSVYIKESGSYRLLVMNINKCTSISDPVKVNVRLDTNIFDFTVSFTQEFSLDSTKFPNIICKKIKLKSKSWKQQTIDNIYLYKNLSFSIPQSYLPIVLEPFGETEFEICYSPKKMVWEFDTLYINDRCEPHILPLKAKGIPNLYTSDSKCEIPLEFETLEISDYYEIFTGPPYPNPAEGIVIVPLKMFYYEQEPELDAYLTDIYHSLNLRGDFEEVSVSEIKEYESSKSEKRSIKVKTVNLSFDVSHLANGIYFIIIKVNNSNQIYKIIKGK